MTPTNSLNPVVIVKNNEAFANSRDVAEFFGKAHKNVIADIRNALEAFQAEISAQSYFIEASYERRTGFGVRLEPAYDMTKDGFTLLVMGYTGSKAMQFKLRYIEEFNRMEAELKTQASALPNFSNPAEAARAWAVEYEAKIALEHKVTEDAPKVEAWQALMTSKGAITMTELAAKLGFKSAQALSKTLHESP